MIISIMEFTDLKMMIDWEFTNQNSAVLMGLTNQEMMVALW